MSDLKLSVIINAVDRMTQPVRKVMQSTERMTESVRRQRNELGRLGRLDSDLKHFRKLKQENLVTSKALTETRTKATMLGRELANTSKPTAKLRKEFEQARRQVKQLEQQQNAQRESLQGLRAGLKQAGYATRTLGDSQRRLRQQTEQANTALQKQQRRLAGIKAARQNISKGMATAANMMFVGHAAQRVGQTATNMLASPIQTAAGFEEAMSGVGAVARANSEQLARLTDNAKMLGATTRYSASEAAGGMKYLAMAGFSTEQIMSTLPGVMNMATAGATDLARASDIGSDILSAFGLKASEMGRVSDVLTATFTRSNTSLEMLGESMKYVGPVARAAGMSLEETSAMAGLLGNVGIKASQAGTTLRTMLQRLAAPTGAAVSTLQELGIEVQDLDGNLRSVPDLLGELAAATKDMGSGERLSILKTLFDTEAAAGVSELIAKEGAKGVTKFTEILKNAGGEAARVARQMDDNASGGFKAMNSAIEGLKISFGDLLLPAVRSLTTMITGLTRRLTAFTQAWPNLSKWLGYGIAVVAGLAFAFAGLMTLLSGLIGSLVITRFGLQALGLSGIFSAGAIKGLAMSFVSLSAKAIPMAIAGIRTLGIAVMSNPIGLIIGGIALAAGLIISNWGSIGPWFSSLWDGIKNAFSGAWGLIKKIFSFTPLGLVVRAWKPMLDWISDKVGWIGDALGGIKNFFGGGEDKPSRKPIQQTGAAAAVSAALVATPAMANTNQAVTHQDHSQYQITVQQLPGEDPEAVAMKVMEKIREYKAGSTGGEMFDE